MVSMISTRERFGQPDHRVCAHLRALESCPTQFDAGDYDAVDNSTKRRRSAKSQLLSEDRHLDENDRRKAVATTRDAARNFALAAWMIRKHLDYVSTFEFQARNKDKGLNRTIEELVEWWSKRHNFDAARRHPRRRFLRLAEACRTKDGDLGIVRLSSGHVQAIEGDRIRTPHLYQNRLGRVVPSDMVHGVQLSKAGAARAYAVCNRNRHGGFVFDRMIPAKHLSLHAYFDRFDQVRGISPILTALNDIRDTYESIDYAKAKAKVHQLFCLAIYSQAAEAVGETVDAEDGETPDGETEKYEVRFDRGPYKLELDDTDRAEFLESRSPSSEFQNFTQLVIAIALKSLDIPYSFFAENYTNYSGQRQAWIHYDQSAHAKRQDNRDLLDDLIAWRMRLFVLDDWLDLPRGMSVGDLKGEWIHRGVPWLQPLQEVKADTMAVALGVTSPQRIVRERTGGDFFDIADEIKEARDYLADDGDGAGAADKTDKETADA